MPDLPSGTVTFLFTDIEGSTRLLQELGAAYRPLLEEHRRRIRHAVAAAGGVEVSTEGDGLFVVSPAAMSAVAAAVDAQRALAETGWPSETKVRVRMGIHTGEGALSAGDYVGLDVHRAARIAAAANGGQVLLSDATRALVDAALPAGTSLRNMGLHRLKDLQQPERLTQLVIDGLPNEFPAIRSLETGLINLPVDMTSFVGRERELTDLRALLRASRLVTLVGPGGSGKTRLAQHVASSLADAFPDGITFVDLAPISDPSLVEATIAGALRLRSEDPRSPHERLIEYLRDRQLLLILDNFEQLLTAAPAVVELVEAAARASVLVTSRAPLRVRGEQTFQVPPLAVPGDLKASPTVALSYDAVTLFVERARSIRPDLTISAADLPVIGQIVARLDGLPLAIELAAARVNILSPKALLDRLDDRRTLMAQGARDLPARQRTLQATITWSHDLLGPADQRLFARFGVFVGGADFDAAERIGAEAGDAGDVGFAGDVGNSGDGVLDRIASLVDSSLIQRIETPTGEPRLRMLETIRAFARERLDEDPRRADVEAAHAAYYLALAEAAKAGLEGDDPSSWLDRLELEQDNLRAALRWAIAAPDRELALRLVAALWRFWHLRGHITEGRRWADAILARPGRPIDRITTAALIGAGGLAYWQVDMVSARTYYEEGLRIARDGGDRWGEAEALRNLGWILAATGDREAAEGSFEQSAAIFQELDDDRGLAGIAFGAGLRRWMVDDYPGAKDRYADALHRYEALGDAYWTATAWSAIGQVDRVTGQLAQAADRYVTAMGIFRRIGDGSGVAMEADLLGVTRLAMGHPELGVRLASAAAALRASIAAGAPAALLRYESVLETARSILDPASYEAASAAGEAMNLDDVVALAQQPVEP